MKYNATFRVDVFLKGWRTTTRSQRACVFPGAHCTSTTWIIVSHMTHSQLMQQALARYATRFEVS